METPLSQVSSLIPLIEQIASDKATEIVTKMLTDAQYSVAKVPDHHHNGSDSSTLGPEALQPFSPAPAATGGVVAPATLGNQQVAQGSVFVGYGTTASGGANLLTQGTFSLAPVPVIYGQGVGVDSAFNGGTAPVGSIIAFTNNGNPALSGLAFKSQFGWLYIQADSLI